MAKRWTFGGREDEKSVSKKLYSLKFTYLRGRKEKSKLANGIMRFPIITNTIDLPKVRTIHNVRGNLLGPAMAVRH